MAGMGTRRPVDDGHAMAAAISEHPAGDLTEIDREAHDWMTRFAAGNADDADLAAFKSWSARDSRHGEAFARACRLWETIGSANEILAARAIANRPEQGVRLGRRAFLGGALTASAAGAFYVTAHPPLDLWPSLSDLAADYRTAPGEQRSIVLSGGPSVELNTRTSIALRTAADGARRIELIRGEAAIAMRPEMGAIELLAADGHIVATNAAFNVRYIGDVVRTTCMSGGLNVSYGGRSVSLRQSEQVVYSADGLGVVSVANSELVTAWKDGILVFQSTPLHEAIAEINRYRAGRILITNAALGRRLFNARFRIATIDGVVAQIREVFGASVTTLPGGIVLLS